MPAWTVAFDVDTYMRIFNLAKRRNTTPQDIIREAVRQYLEREGART
jgi:predicted transcriptional regulator